MFPSRHGDRIYLNKVWIGPRIFYSIPIPKFLNSLVVTLYQSSQMQQHGWPMPDDKHPKEFGKGIWHPFGY